RRLVEFVVDDLLRRPKTSPDLDRKIEETAARGVAPWIRSYMICCVFLGMRRAAVRVQRELEFRYCPEWTGRYDSPAARKRRATEPPRVPGPMIPLCSAPALAAAPAEAETAGPSR